MPCLQRLFRAQRSVSTSSGMAAPRGEEPAERACCLGGLMALCELGCRRLSEDPGWGPPCAQCTRADDSSPAAALRAW